MSLYEQSVQKMPFTITWATTLISVWVKSKFTSVLTAKPPAPRITITSQLIADHLNALHLARQAFIQSETSKKLKTASQRQTCTVTMVNWDH